MFGFFKNVQKTRFVNMGGHNDNGTPAVSPWRGESPPLLSMPDQLRQKAAMATRLAAYIPADRAAEVLRSLSVELEKRAVTIETAALQKKC